MKIILLLLFYFFSHTLFSQDQRKLILQNQYNGGVCSVGFDILGWGYTASTQTIPYYIEPSSSISKVYMIYTTHNNLDTLNYTLKINNQTYNLNQSDITIPFYNVPQIGIGNIYTH